MIIFKKQNYKKNAQQHSNYVKFKILIYVFVSIAVFNKKNRSQHCL